MALEHPKASADALTISGRGPGGRRRRRTRARPGRMSGPGETAVGEGKPGRVKRTAAWSKATATKAADRAGRERQRHVSVDVGCMN